MTTIVKLPVICLVASLFSWGCSKDAPQEPLMPPEPDSYQLPKDGGDSSSPLSVDAPQSSDIPEAPPVVEEAQPEDFIGVDTVKTPKKKKSSKPSKKDKASKK